MQKNDQIYNKKQFFQNQNGNAKTTHMWLAWVIISSLMINWMYDFDFGRKQFFGNNLLFSGY